MTKPKSTNLTARKTLYLTCMATRILGGMDHVDAARVLGVPLPKDCRCGLMRLIQEG